MTKRISSWSLLKALKPQGSSPFFFFFEILMRSFAKVRNLAQDGDLIGRWPTSERHLTHAPSVTYLFRRTSSLGPIIELEMVSPKRNFTECYVIHQDYPVT